MHAKHALGGLTESVTRVVPLEDFFLGLWFNTGDHRLFDAKPYLNRGVFKQLQDIALFNQAFVSLISKPGIIEPWRQKVLDMLGTDPCRTPYHCLIYAVCV